MSPKYPTPQTDGASRVVMCKPYHKPTKRAPAGRPRKKEEQKSRCPHWADGADVRQALIQEALADPDGGQDMFGRPKLIWNALENTIFIGRSCNTSEPMYDCYPETFPNGKLYETLYARAARRLDDYLSERGLRRC